MPGPNPIISVVIPSYKEATYIDRFLEALTRQKFETFEVIVSDGTSGDGTDGVVRQFADRLDIRYLEAPPLGPGHGRNAGGKLARGEWLLFMDADNDIDDPDFIGKLFRACRDRGWSTASARFRIRNGSLGERIGVRLNYRYLKFLSRTRHPVAPGWCIFTKRSVFEEAGGFSEKIRFGEDYDYVSRVGRLGFGFVPKAEYFADLRRNRQEGLGLMIKAVRNEIYRHRHGYNLENSPFDYPFGNHGERRK